MQTFLVSLYCFEHALFIFLDNSSRSGTEVTHLPPTSEVYGSNPEPYVGKMVVSCR